MVPSFGSRAGIAAARGARAHPLAETKGIMGRQRGPLPPSSFWPAPPPAAAAHAHGHRASAEIVHTLAYFHTQLCIKQQYDWPEALSRDMSSSSST